MWGGLVRSSSAFPLIDGGFVTAPENRVFAADGTWIAENEGIAPDIEVKIDAIAYAAGRDPQLERAVEELLRRLPATPGGPLTAPAPTTPALQ